jgi:2'-5' RNA ligase
MIHDRTTNNSSLALFCAAINRRPLAPTTQSNSKLIALQSSKFPRSSSENDWFQDGREAAQRLKMELGIENNGDVRFRSDTKIEEWNNNFAGNDVALDLESGRAAARELLNTMKHDGNDSPLLQLQLSSDDSVNKIEESSSSSSSYFDLPLRKSHCRTICLVPPPSATATWDRLKTVRRECKDPGFYRWPPHTNILYPFIEPIFSSEDGVERSIEDNRIPFRDELISHLSSAAEKIEPFDVTIDSFGTFGNNQRGVLWAYPKSQWKQKSNDKEEDEEPLLRLHKLLEQQFPMCTDTRKSGAFHPHTTISHYANNNDALIAKERVEAGWKPVSFHVPEIYLLERKGDDGQFQISATIPLGGVNSKKVEFHDPPISFPGMPQSEETWVYDERMDMKSRRKMNMKRGRRGRRSNERDCSQED